MDVLLGIDVGTSGVKTVALSTEGLLLASSSASYPLLTPRPGWVEQDPEDWLAAVRSTVSACLSEIHDGPSRVAAVSLSGHMSSVVMVDDAGQALRPCLMLTDARGADESRSLASKVEEKVRALTGGSVRAGSMAAKLLWIKRHEPEVYGKSAAFLTAKDFVRLNLTGEACTEPTDAGNTMFLDPLARKWARDLYEEMDLDVRQLPRLIETTDVAGTITAQAAQQTGLLAGTPVIAGGADMACSAVGTGCVEDGVVAVTIGTAAQVVTLAHKVDPGCAGRVSFHPHAFPGALYAMGSIFSGGLTLRWIRQAIGENEAVLSRSGSYYDRLSELAGEVPAGSGGVIFLPFLVGSGSPEFDPAIRAGFIGLSLATDTRALIRAAMEGVSYNARDCLAVFRDAGLPMRTLHMGGGGSVSRTWRSIMAGVLGDPVRPLAMRDASALGAAAIAGVGIGAFGSVSEASKKLVSFDEDVSAAPDDIATYDRNYRIYDMARNALKSVYRYRDSIGG